MRPRGALRLPGASSSLSNRLVAQARLNRLAPVSTLPASDIQPFNRLSWLAARRTLSTSCSVMHGGINRPKPGSGISVTFRKSNGEEITVEGNEGDDIVDLSWEYDLDIEAACEKSIACSTCHIILPPDVYDRLEEPSDDENDMLDLAFGLTDTSRLGCQIKLEPFMDGMTIQLPSATRNMAVDGHKPQAH